MSAPSGKKERVLYDRNGLVNVLDSESIYDLQRDLQKNNGHVLDLLFEMCGYIVCPICDLLI